MVMDFFAPAPENIPRSPPTQGVNMRLLRISLTLGLLVTLLAAPTRGEDAVAKAADASAGRLKLALVNIKSVYSDGPEAKTNQANLEANLKRHLETMP